MCAFVHLNQVENLVLVEYMHESTGSFLVQAPGRGRLRQVLMHRWRLIFVCFVVCFFASCSSGATSTMEDPCALKPVIAGGSVELGLGNIFMPVVAGQNVELQLGAQGLWMFILNGRARDMDVGSGDREGVIDAAVFDQNGETISLALGCRRREFAETADGYLEFTSPFQLPLNPNVMVDGATVTIHLQVRDTEGRQATDERAVVAHVPVIQNP